MARRKYPTQCTTPLVCFFQDDDGFILYESRAICYYIAAKYPDQGTPLLPTELKATALFHQAASVEICHFSDNIVKASAEKLYKPWVFFFRRDHRTECLMDRDSFLLHSYHGLQPDEEAFEKHIAALALKLDVYDKILSKQKYVAGDVCDLHNYVNMMNMHLCGFLFLLGILTSRHLSYRCGIRGFENGKRPSRIGVAAPC